MSRSFPAAQAPRLARSLSRTQAPEPARAVHVWRAPVALALASAIGLVSALLADGAGDVLAWLTLGAPVFVVGWCVLPSVQRAFFSERRNVP